MIKKRNYSIAISNIEVRPGIQKEYVEFHNQASSEPYPKNEIGVLEPTLFNNRNDKEQKEILFRLAHTQDIKAYELLKWFYETTQGNSEDN